MRSRRRALTEEQKDAFLTSVPEPTIAAEDFAALARLAAAERWNVSWASPSRNGELLRVFRTLLIRMFVASWIAENWERFDATTAATLQTIVMRAAESTAVARRLLAAQPFNLAPPTPLSPSRDTQRNDRVSITVQTIVGSQRW